MKKTYDSGTEKAGMIYDEFHGVLRCLNGGTSEENKNMSARCFNRLREVAKKAKTALENPSKRLVENDHLFNALADMENRTIVFGNRYNLT